MKHFDYRQLLTGPGCAMCHHPQTTGQRSSGVTKLQTMSFNMYQNNI